MKTLAVGATLLAAALVQAPIARADMIVGNYEIHWSRPWDFHTYLLQIRNCLTEDGMETVPGCLHVGINPRPIAKATQWSATAHLVEGRYTLTVDVPFGYGCGGYYGPVVPTRDVYTWDANTLTGVMESSFAVGPCGEPGGTISYPFTLVRY